MQAFGYSPENSFVSAPANGSLAEVKVSICHCQLPIPSCDLWTMLRLLLCTNTSTGLRGLCVLQIIMSADNGQVGY